MTERWIAEQNPAGSGSIDGVTVTVQPPWAPAMAARQRNTVMMSQLRIRDERGRSM
jgi:hypothetical protein